MNLAQVPMPLPAQATTLHPGREVPAPGGHRVTARVHAGAAHPAMVSVIGGRNAIALTPADALRLAAMLAAAAAVASERVDRCDVQPLLDVLQDAIG